MFSLSLKTLPGFSPSGSHLTEGWKAQPPVTNGEWDWGYFSESTSSKCGMGGEARRVFDWDSLCQDLFHWQIMGGNLTKSIQEFLPIVGKRNHFLCFPALQCFFLCPTS